MGIWARLRRLWIVLFGSVAWDAPKWARAVGGKAKAGGGGRRRTRAPPPAPSRASWPCRPGWLLRAAVVEEPAPPYRDAGDRDRARRHPHRGQRASPYAAVIDFGGRPRRLKNVGKKSRPASSSRPRSRAPGVGERRRLSSTPRSDWPVGQEYTVRLAEGGPGRARTSLLDYAADVHHRAVQACGRRRAQFYQDPVDANLKKVVATLVHPSRRPRAVREARGAAASSRRDKEDKEADYKCTSATTS